MSFMLYHTYGSLGHCVFVYVWVCVRTIATGVISQHTLKGFPPQLQEVFVNINLQAGWGSLFHWTVQKLFNKHVQGNWGELSAEILTNLWNSDHSDRSNVFCIFLHSSEFPILSFILILTYYFLIIHWTCWLKILRGILFHL